MIAQQCINGDTARGQILTPPTESQPLNRLPNNWSVVNHIDEMTPIPNLKKSCPQGASWKMAEIQLCGFFNFSKIHMQLINGV